MKTKLRKIGNSTGLTLSKTFLETLQLKADDEVEVSMEGGLLTISPLKNTHKEWATWLDQNPVAKNEILLDESPNTFDEEDWTW